MTHAPSLGERVASQRTFRDSGGNVVYLEIERA